MFLDSNLRKQVSVRLPRACGGVSDPMEPPPKPEESSPRLRGCFYLHRLAIEDIFVFPAPAGVFLKYVDMDDTIAESSPRLRGCFFLKMAC